MPLTGSLFSGESSIAMKIRLLKEYGGLQEATVWTGCKDPSWGRGVILERGCSGSRLFLWCSQLRQVRSSSSLTFAWFWNFCSSWHWDVAQCKRGEEDWTHSALDGESEAGDGGKDVGESGCGRQPFERVCCGEEKGSDPVGDEGGSVWKRSSIFFPGGHSKVHPAAPLLKHKTEINQNKLLWGVTIHHFYRILKPHLPQRIFRQKSSLLFIPPSKDLRYHETYYIPGGVI